MFVQVNLILTNKKINVFVMIHYLISMQHNLNVYLYQIVTPLVYKIQTMLIVNVQQIVYFATDN